MQKAVLTCALTGVLTNPKQHPVPVTPQQMAAEARDAYNAGASIMHVHLRQQEEGAGHMPSWDPEVAAEVCDAIRGACPGVVINLTTGVVGKDISGPVACIRRVKPEIAACNAGSLNFVMGVASGMPVDADLLALLLRWITPGALWQTTLIGRAEIWPVHQATADLGGMLRSGLEDTFYLPNGERAKGNGQLIQELAQCARRAGREIASPAETRAIMGLA